MKRCVHNSAKVYVQNASTDSILITSAQSNHVLSYNTRYINIKIRVPSTQNS